MDKCVGKSVPMLMQRKGILEAKPINSCPWNLTYNNQAHVTLAKQ